MSDQDRGAYTPQTDEPLAFDARRPSERRPVPMTLIGSVLVLALLIGGVALVYRGGVRGTGEAPRPVGQPVMSVKTAPNVSPPANTTAADQDVYAETKTTSAGPAANAEGSATTTTATTSAATPATATPATAPPATVASSAPAPTFAPQAEQPVARPKPSPQTLAMMAPPKPKPAPRPRPTVVARARTVTTATASSNELDASEVAAAGMTRASDRTGTVKLAQAAPAQNAATKARRAAAAAEEDDAATTPAVAPVTPTPRAARPRTETAATVAPTGAHRGPSVVQIGAFSSSILADKGYADVSADMAGRMSGKSKHVMTVDKDGKTLYRTWVSGFATRADAIAFCETLKARSKSCIVKS